MTGTWRDTLFVWGGGLDEETSKDEKDVSDLTWEGSWVGCQDCPDARTAPTPNRTAFAVSEMKFHVSGKGQKRGDFWHYETIEGPGWDLGEGNEKQKHKDHKHEILTKDRIADYGASRDFKVVVAKGVNDFGDFISAGYVSPDSSIRSAFSDKRGLILARRYLDAGDARAKWSIEELYRRVSEADRGFTKVLNDDEDWRIASWRTMDLHAKKLSSKRKRDHTPPAEADGELPPLNITSEEFDSELNISISQGLSSNVKWLEQCYGCGKEIRDQEAACHIYVMMWRFEGGRHEPEDTYYAIYCDKECVMTNGAKAWAQCGKSFLEMFSSGDFLESTDGSNFFDVIETDKKARKTLENAGWRICGHNMQEKWRITCK